MSLLYEGYVELAERGFVPVFIPTGEGLFIGVLAPDEGQLERIKVQPGKWLFESCRAVRRLAENDGFTLIEEN